MYDCMTIRSHDNMTADLSQHSQENTQYHHNIIIIISLTEGGSGDQTVIHVIRNVNNLIRL